jgi:hypothetical protein
MNCFQIIKSILDEEYDQIPGNAALVAPSFKNKKEN